MKEIITFSVSRAMFIALYNHVPKSYGTGLNLSTKVVNLENYLTSYIYNGGEKDELFNKLDELKLHPLEEIEISLKEGE